MRENFEKIKRRIKILPPGKQKKPIEVIRSSTVIYM